MVVIHPSPFSNSCLIVFFSVSLGSKKRGIRNYQRTSKGTMTYPSSWTSRLEPIRYLLDRVISFNCLHIVSLLKICGLYQVHLKMFFDQCSSSQEGIPETCGKKLQLKPLWPGYNTDLDTRDHLIVCVDYRSSPQSFGEDRTSIAPPSLLFSFIPLYSLTWNRNERTNNKKLSIKGPNMYE